MSNHPTSKEPTAVPVTLSALGISGLVISFLLVVTLMVVLNRPSSVDDALAEKRHKTLSEVQSWHEEILTTYGWVDRSAGVVRVPIERAMELTVEKLSDHQPSMAVEGQ